MLPQDFDKRITDQTERAMSKVYAKAGAMKSLGNLRVFAPWWGLNLTSLNPDLGSYFGSDKGVLVLSAEDDDFKQLKAGLNKPHSTAMSNAAGNGKVSAPPPRLAERCASA